ncbi:MAG TPA: MFS transporter, partial [Vicinamibacterales bacterium]|nr:MFS transporter [Vicinamibacterales bacterium]
MAVDTARPITRRTVLASLGQPKVAIMLMLGFSSGLPFFLTGNTLGYWLRDQGTTLQAIGFLSWVGLAYSLKFLWAPVVDRLDAPIFARLGRRRSWMLLTQALIGAGLFGMAAAGTRYGLPTIGALALLVAFSSSTQDIVIDAWRIEAASDSDELGLLSAAYQLGYRAAIIVTDALILISANHLGWRISYGAMAVLMAVGIAATVFAIEPRRSEARSDSSRRAMQLGSLRGFTEAVVGPFVEFFKA